MSCCDALVLNGPFNSPNRHCLHWQLYSGTHVAHTETTDSRPVEHFPLGRSEEAVLMLEDYKGVEGRALAAQPATLL